MRRVLQNTRTTQVIYYHDNTNEVRIIACYIWKLKQWPFPCKALQFPAAQPSSNASGLKEKSGTGVSCVDCRSMREIVGKEITLQADLCRTFKEKVEGLDLIYQRRISGFYSWTNSRRGDLQTSLGAVQDRGLLYVTQPPCLPCPFQTEIWPC